MKKKPLLWIVLSVGAVLLIAVALWGRQYYIDRYVGADYYAMVPLDYDMTPTPVKTMDGKEIGAAIEYKLTAYNEHGEAKSVEFKVVDPDSDISLGEEQPQPGTYLWISASKQLVVRWKAIGQVDVPKPALEKIRETSTPPTTEQWRAPDNTVSAWFDESLPEGYDDIDTQVMQVGKTADGKDIFTLLRLPLEGTWLADEVRGARLFLKLKEGPAPVALRVGLVAQAWDFAMASQSEAKALVDIQSLATRKVKQEENGWVSIDVTGCVKSWLGCKAPNYGMALFGEAAGETAVFVSGWSEDEAQFPYLVVSGAVGERPICGKFDYAQQPAEGVGTEEGGNCMAYALRNTGMILIDDLGADFDEMNRLYQASGEDAVAEYFAQLVEDYVEAHKDGLHISGLRRIADFDSEIDAAKEYRMAMRVGCKVFGEADLGGKGCFDYHFWAQLRDGRWAQKFPLDPSEIIPCIGPGISPGTYPWDSGLQWYPKTQGYYSSKVVYFAVAKDTDSFTGHGG